MQSPSRIDGQVIPVFILSLPRSGSTLLQCMLAARSDNAIETAFETWLLLPLLYPLSGRGCLAEFDMRSMPNVINRLEQRMPGGGGSVSRELAALATRIYTQISNKKSIYFLDKTPVYSLFASNLLRLFPQAKFILLWRNPLAVAASNMRLFSDSRLQLRQQYFELYRGLTRLHEMVSVNRNNIHVLNYETLIAQPAETITAVFEYLSLPNDPGVLTRFSNVTLGGGDTVSDQAGRLRFDQLNNESVTSWVNNFNSPVRRLWARNYLKWIGDERLHAMGYKRDELLKCLPEGGGWARSLKDLKDVAVDLLKNRIKEKAVDLYLDRK